MPVRVLNNFILLFLFRLLQSRAGLANQSGATSTSYSLDHFANWEADEEDEWSKMQQQMTIKVDQHEQRRGDGQFGSISSSSSSSSSSSMFDDDDGLRRTARSRKRPDVYKYETIRAFDYCILETP